MQNDHIRLGDRNFIARLISTNRETEVEAILLRHGLRYFTRHQSGYRVISVAWNGDRYLDIRGALGRKVVKATFLLDEVK